MWDAFHFGGWYDSRLRRAIYVWLVSPECPVVAKEDNEMNTGSSVDQLMVLITTNCLFFPWPLGDPCQSLSVLYTTGKLNKDNTQRAGGGGDNSRIEAACILLLTTPFLSVSDEYHKQQEPHQRLSSSKTSPRWWIGRGRPLHTIMYRRVTNDKLERKRSWTMLRNWGISSRILLRVVCFWTKFLTRHLPNTK